MTAWASLDNRFDLAHRTRLAGWLGIAAAASLPWSTSATSILVPLWLLAMLSTLDRTAARRLITLPAAALPVALVVLAVVGVLWADAPWSYRLHGIEPFVKLLAIPILLACFARTGQGDPVLRGFFLSACALLAASWFIVLIPVPAWATKGFGVPVKDYISQSAIFTLCMFGLFERAITDWNATRARSVALIVLAALFLASMVFIVTARTAVVVIVVLLLVLGLRQSGRGAFAVFFAGVVALAALSWTMSPYLRQRLTDVVTEVEIYQPHTGNTSAGLRLEFWKDSLALIQSAPLTGHGTGSTRFAFARHAGTDPMAVDATTNPHNQFFAVAVQLGLIGGALLIAMWLAHLRLFLGPGRDAWLGLMLVIQNIVSSMINSHLFDFTHGWLYVLGVGVIGGMVLRTDARDRT